MVDHILPALTYEDGLRAGAKVCADAAVRLAGIGKRVSQVDMHTVEVLGSMERRILALVPAASDQGETTKPVPVQGRDGDLLCPTCGSNSTEPCARDEGKMCRWPGGSRPGR